MLRSRARCRPATISVRGVGGSRGGSRVDLWKGPGSGNRSPPGTRADVPRLGARRPPESAGGWRGGSSVGRGRAATVRDMASQALGPGLTTRIPPCRCTSRASTTGDKKRTIARGWALGAAIRNSMGRARPEEATGAAHANLPAVRGEEGLFRRVRANAARPALHRAFARKGRSGRVGEEGQCRACSVRVPPLWRFSRSPHLATEMSSSGLVALALACSSPSVSHARHAMRHPEGIPQAPSCGTLVRRATHGKR